MMNWNAKPESAPLPPLYPKSQASFLQQALINPLTSASQSSFHYAGNNQEACMFPSNSNPMSQPLHSIRHKTQQIPISEEHNGTIAASQTSVERITYTNVKGHKQLNHNLQTSSGVTQSVWMNSTTRNPMLSHTRTTISNQAGFGANTSNLHGLPNQFVTSGTYSMELQMPPSNSVRVPYQGNKKLNPSFSERQVDWPQQSVHKISNGLILPRPFPNQYSFSQQSYLQDPPIQKQNPMSSTSLRVKNNQFPNPALSLQSHQNAAIQSHQYVVIQADSRPPPPSYDYHCASQPFQSTQHVVKHPSAEVPWNQETHLSKKRKDFCRGFQQQWQAPNEKVSMVGNSCNLKENASVRPFVDSVQTLAQNNQDKRIDSCNPTSNQVLDTNATKENLVKDIKALVEMKRKFSELAMKIKINKNLLVAAGCNKTNNTSCSESAQNSELSLKQNAQIQSRPQTTPVTQEISENKVQRVMESAEKTNKTPCTLTSNIQEMNYRKFNQVNSVLPNSVCSEKLPMLDWFNDLKVSPFLKAPVDITQTALNNTQFSSENFVRDAQNLPTNSETISHPHSAPFKEYALKHPEKNPLLLSLLESEDKTEKNLLKDVSETIQDSKPDSSEMNQNTQTTGNQPNLKTLKIVSPSNRSDTVSDSSVCLEPQSSIDAMPYKRNDHCSMELLATCLSLWKKQPSEPSEKKQCNESGINTAAVGKPKPVEVIDGTSPYAVEENSQNKMVKKSQETALSSIVQNYESSGTNTAKGTELQIAVVPPLILLDVKTLSVKGITPEALPETVYPVIKEGSVCSLQDQPAENTTLTGSLKADVDGLVESTTSSTKKESTNDNSEGVPNASQEEDINSEPDIHSVPNTDTSGCLGVSDNQKVLYKLEDSISVSSGDVLQIASICSLVEGDASYNSQIAKMFSSPPLKRVEPQKLSLSDHQVVYSGQEKEQLDEITEDKNFDFQKEKIVQFTDVSPKIADLSKSQLPSESSALKYVNVDTGVQAEHNLECIIKEESTTTDSCSLLPLQKEICLQKIDASSNYIPQDPTSSEISSDKTSDLYLHDQLSELLKEFPYGIEPVNIQDGSVGQQIADEKSKTAETNDKTSCDSKDSTDQIQITILSSEQMKELFPEQDDQPCDIENSAGPQVEKPVTKVGSQNDPQVQTEESRDSFLSDSDKDDVRCCALGWLSMVYEGVPQCQCNAIDTSPSEKEKKKDQCFSLEISSHKGKITSDRGVPIVEFKSASDSNLKIPPGLADKKNHFPEREQGKNTKDKSKRKHISERREQELSGQSLSKNDKKLDSSFYSHKRKRKLKFHEVTFHSSNMINFYDQNSQESLQKKYTAQNLRPIKPKTALMTSNNLHRKNKNDSLKQSILPEKIKFKVGVSGYKLLEKRRLNLGATVDREIKRKKLDEQKQNKNVGSTSKLCNTSNPNERANIKEKTVSLEVEFTNLEINMHKNVIKSSNANIKSSDLKDISCKINRVLISKDCLQRQKRKEVVGNKARKNGCVIEKVKNMSIESECMKPSKLSRQTESCGKPNERYSSVQTDKESLNLSHAKNLKTHLSEGSKIHNTSQNIKGKVVEKQPDKMHTDKTKLDNNLININNEVKFSQTSHQTKNQGKLYLNRVAFKCTERQSLYLTKLDSSPRKLNEDKEKSQKHQLKSVLLPEGTTERTGILQFKLCPEGLLNGTDGVEEQKDLKPCPRKEQAPVQVLKGMTNNI
ncbi:retroelement silencing factor 1 isoform X2 [Tamandua tetradactyla]|uniref:retroelement silencing factor 1 isoform X2 n=1 Tax=Tamandua tetradactyla TaxID=48850 RepID=UPI0040546959